MNTTFENLNTTERFVRAAISVAAIVMLMESSLVGSMLFAVACLLAIALAMTAIIGWDPLKFANWNISQENKATRITHTQKHA